MIVYKVISTVEQKREGSNYKPACYSTFKEALNHLKETIDLLNYMGGFMCIPLSDVCYEINALYTGYSKKLGSIYIKKYDEQ